MDYRFFGEKASLEAARKLANYLIDRWSADPDRKPGGGTITVHMAVTGVESAMLALHNATQDRRYLDFCVQMRKLPDWNARIVTGRHGPIEGHAYAHMCRCIAQLRLDRLQPDQRLLKPAHDVIDFLTGHNGLVITGACGDHECWHDTQEGTLNLGETCATSYLIRMLDELLRMEGKPLYGDLMERAIYNALFAAQSPDGRQIRYYSPFDGPREYFKGDTYCCPCNYRRIVAELPGMICYRAARRGGGESVHAFHRQGALAAEQRGDHPARDEVSARRFGGPERRSGSACRIQAPVARAALVRRAGRGRQRRTAAGQGPARRVARDRPPLAGWRHGAAGNADEVAIGQRPPGAGRAASP